MQSISQFALAASIFTSVAGALVMCVLVFRYGFTIPAPSDAEAGPTPTDVLMTRAGHAVAGTCFAATAVLAILALSLRAPERAAPSATAVVAPAPVPEVAPAEPGAEARASRLDSDLGALQVRLAEAESRQARLDAEIRRRSARAAALEQKRAVARREVRTPPRTSAIGAQIQDRSGGLVSAARERWQTSRQRAADLVGDVRAAFTRAERTVVQHVGDDPRSRVSARD